MCVCAAGGRRGRLAGRRGPFYGARIGHVKFLQGLAKPRAKKSGGYDLLRQEDARAKKAAKKSKAEAAKKAARPKKPDISYRITPANYLILSEDEKADILRRFVRVIATLDERRRLRISIVHRKAAA